MANGKLPVSLGASELFIEINNCLMKKWNFRIKNNPQNIIEKLDTSLESFGGFIFKMNQDKNDAVIFNFHKRVIYPDQILHRNRIVVNGKIIKANAENEADVEISFAQHFFMKLTIFSIIVFGLALLVLIPRISSGVSMFLLGGGLFALGFVLWITLQKKMETDIQKYKTLISKILEA